jgi:hypothetical protein
MGLLSYDSCELNSINEAAEALTVEPTQQQQQQRQDTAVDRTDTTANTVSGSGASQADVTADVDTNVAAAAAAVLPVALSDAQLLQLLMKAPALAANCVSTIQHDQPHCANRVTAILDTLAQRSQQCGDSGDAVNAELMLYARQQLCAAVQYCADSQQSDDTSVLSRWQKLLSDSAQTAFAIEQKVSTPHIAATVLLIRHYCSCEQHYCCSNGLYMVLLSLHTSLACLTTVHTSCSLRMTTLNTCSNLPHCSLCCI